MVPIHMLISTNQTLCNYLIQSPTCLLLVFVLLFSILLWKEQKKQKARVSHNAPC